MCTRHLGFIVTLRSDVMGEDAEKVLSAIQQLKGVIAVAPVDDDPNSWMAREQARYEFVKKINKFLEEI